LGVDSVDDIILVENDKEEIDRIKQALNKTFKIKDLGDLRYFLMMNQRRYALELLKDGGLLECKPAITPFTDITFSVQHLSQFLYKPTIAHYNAVIIILR